MSNRKLVCLEAEIIETEGGKYFGFLVALPGICSQGDSEQEVLNGLRKNLQIFLEKAQKTLLQNPNP